MSLNDVIALLTYKPAELLNLPAGTLSPGVAADVAIIDPEGKWEVNHDTIFSKSQNSPWWKQELTGQTIQTIVAGQTVFADGKIVS